MGGRPPLAYVVLASITLSLAVALTLADPLPPYHAVLNEIAGLLRANYAAAEAGGDLSEDRRQQLQDALESILPPTRSWNHARTILSKYLDHGLALDEGDYLSQRPWLQHDPHVSEPGFPWFDYILNDTDVPPATFHPLPQHYTPPIRPLPGVDVRAATRSGVYICAIVNDEAVHLPEWIEYYYRLHVQGIVVYDHGSTDHTRPLLQRYSPFVELVEWDVPYDWSSLAVNHQYAAYNQCARSLVHRARFVAFLDVDEFVHLDAAHGSIPQLVDHIVGRAALAPQQIAAVALHWSTVGTSGVFADPPSLYAYLHPSRPPPPSQPWRVPDVRVVCTLRRICRASIPMNHVFDVKLFARPAAVGFFINAHNFVPSTPGLYIVDASGRELTSSSRVLHSPARVDHYWSRSFLDYVVKAAKRTRFNYARFEIDLAFFLNFTLACYPTHPRPLPAPPFC